MARNFVKASSQRVEVTACPIGTTLPVTMAGWFYTTNYPAANAIIYSFSASASIPQLIILMAPTGNVYNFWANASISDNIGTTATVTNSVYQHAAVTFTTTEIAVYLNGGNRVAKSGTYTLATMNRSTVGALDFNGGGPGQYFNGLIGECAAWTALLTNAQIAVLATGIPANRIEPNNLVHYWPMYGVTSPEVNLASTGATYNGTVTGATLANHPPMSRYAPRPYVGPRTTQPHPTAGDRHHRFARSWFG